MKKYKEDFKKVRLFLKELEPIEFRYLELTMQMVSGIQSLIKNYSLDKKQFCELFHISPKRYNDYTKGNFNYSVNDMATMNAAYQKLEIERVNEIDMVKIGNVEEK